MATEVDTSEVTLKKGLVEQASEITALGRQTFYDAFAAANTPEDMDQYLSEAFTVEKFVDQLKNPNSHFFVAYADGEMVGYTKFNLGDAQTEPLGENAMEIERIYVKPQFYGKSVGQLMYQKAYDFAIENHCSLMWLGVWEKNERGLRFYKKNGFVEFSKHVFLLGKDPQTDLMLKRTLP
jgi:ribosomal protein S18 acetylase RimI-like enzyme